MTTLKSFLPSGFQFAWDATSLTSYSTCPRYYQLNILEGWSPNVKSPHLIFGGIYATALEHFFKNVAGGATREEALLMVVRSALVESWDHERDEEGNRIAGTGAAWESLHNTKTRDTLIRSIVWYFCHFAKDTTETVHLSDGTPAVEYSFSVPLNEDYVYCGHIDRLVRYGEHNYVMDQKTTGTTITPRYFLQFSPDNQMSGYSWAGKIIFDLPISGVIIDAAQIAVGFTKFERGFVARNDALLEEWHDNALAVIAEAKHSHETNHYRMNQTACGNYGGCPYRGVCSRHPKHRDSLLAANFVQRPRWDPLEKR